MNFRPIGTRFAQSSARTAKVDLKVAFGKAFKVAFFGTALAAIGVFATGSAMAQAGSKIVRDIDIKYVGKAAVSKDRILANISTRVGDVLSPAKIDEDIKNLYASGDIENIRVLSKPVGADGVNLLIVVQTRAVLGGVAFEGNSVFDSDKLRKEANLDINEAIDEKKVQEGRTKIQSLYRKRGYPDSNVSYSVSAPNEQGYSTILFAINEGGKGVLRDVTFVGNSVFSSAELKKQMEQRPKGLLNPFAKPGRIDNSRLEADVRAIEEHYQNHGYISATVVNVSRVRADDGESVDLVITIDEGDIYTIGSVSVVGVEALSQSSEIAPYLKVKAGSYYSGQQLKDDIKLIKDQYGTKGYADTQVMPRLEPVNGGTAVNVIYQVSEGRSFTIGQINIEGNTKTKDHVIRRELAALPGEPFDTVAIDASRRRLMNLNYFETVDIMPVDTSYLNEKDLVISVAERPTGTINFGAGFSSIDDLVGFVEVSQTNFDITNWPSLTGGGQRFRTSARVGTSRMDFSIALTEPWFMGKRLALTGEGFYRDLRFLSDYYDQTEVGGAVSLRKPVGEFASTTLQYTPKQVEIDVENNASDVLKSEDGDFFSSVIGLDVTHDTRDNLFLPREGHRFVAGVDTGVGGDVGATTFAISASQHVNGPWDSIFSVVGRYANVNSADHIFTRQFLGGANTLRGFDYRDVGPKDENGEPLGGDQAWNATAEVTFPIVEKIRPAIFYDIGEVSGGPGQFGGGVNSNYGFGVRLFILGGAPIRLDYGIPTQADEYNDGSGRFNFTMGYQF